jgi:hypothetical protein
MNRDRFSWVAGLLGAILLILANGNAFNLMRQASVEELMLESSTIVTATVSSMSSKWDVNNGKMGIYTHITLSVEGYVKGSGPQIIVLRLFGWRVDNVAELISYIPPFAVEKNVLLFLSEDHSHVIGGRQDKFTIRDDKVVRVNIPVHYFINQLKNIMKQSFPQSSSGEQHQKDLLSTRPASMKLGEQFTNKLKKEIADPHGAVTSTIRIAEQRARGAQGVDLLVLTPQATGAC